TNQLQITPAHHVSLRSIPRKISDESKAKGRSLAQQREALGQEFGTKKAKKVIASRTENAITKGNQSGVQSGAQNAVLENMADAEAEAPGKEQVEQDQLASKPIPRPNLSAESVEQVYTFNTLIPQGEARLVPVKDWQERARADQEMTFSHRYPAHRVAAIGKSDDMLKLKALSYLNLLLDFHDALQGAGRSGKKVPKKEILSKKMDKWPETLVDLVRRRFSNPQNELPKWHQDNLYTHMAALTLYIDGWTTNTTDLKEDLRIENRQITQYFNELGCRVGPLTEKERERLGVPKAVAGSMRMARLKLPLDFPKPRAGRRR
ncbi:RNA polymerase I associated factor, A49-like protein, partial [Hortaea werneckii]